MSSADHREIILEPGRVERNYWRDLWRYRELFQVLAWRDIAVRYKQTVIGVVWAVLRPFLAMVVFTVIFGKVAKLPTEGAAPYSLMVFAGMLPWTFFSTALSEAGNSLTANTNLISKIYFPRMIVPVATIVVAFVDLLIGFALIVGMMAWYQFLPGWQVIFLPLFVFMAVAASIGPGLWVTAINVRYRDFRYVIPFVVQFGLYISPVAFSSQVVPEKWRLLYNLNPMVSVIDGFRWCLLGQGAEIYWPGLAVGLAMILFMLWQGISQFRKLEKTFADII